MPEMPPPVELYISDESIVMLVDTIRVGIPIAVYGLPEQELLLQHMGYDERIRYITELAKKVPRNQLQESHVA